MISQAKANKIIKSLRCQMADYFQKHNLKLAVFGKSKGVDSSLLAALLAGIPSIKSLALVMPCYSDPDEENIATEVLEYYKIPYFKINLDKTYDFLLNQYENKQNISKGLKKLHVKTFQDKQKYAKGNIKARLRMISLYHVAQITRGAVIASANFSEYMTGFWTLHGDVGDIYPLASLFKSSEIYALAKALKVPQSSLKAIPDDGLQINGTDEQQLGLKYAELDQIIGLFLKNKTAGEIQDIANINKEKVSRALRRIKGFEYKRKAPVLFDKNI